MSWLRTYSSLGLPLPLVVGVNSSPWTWTGRIKSFRCPYLQIGKKWGFIECPYLHTFYERDVYFHEVEWTDSGDVEIGIEVSFNLSHDVKTGYPKAINVRRIATYCEDDTAMAGDSKVVEICNDGVASDWNVISISRSLESPSPDTLLDCKTGEAENVISISKSCESLQPDAGLACKIDEAEEREWVVLDLEVDNLDETSSQLFFSLDSAP